MHPGTAPLAKVVAQRPIRVRVTRALEKFAQERALRRFPQPDGAPCYSINDILNSIAALSSDDTQKQLYSELAACSACIEAAERTEPPLGSMEEIRKFVTEQRYQSALAQKRAPRCAAEDAKETAALLRRAGALAASSLVLGLALQRTYATHSSLATAAAIGLTLLVASLGLDLCRFALQDARAASQTEAGRRAS